MYKRTFVIKRETFLAYKAHNRRKVFEKTKLKDPKFTYWKYGYNKALRDITAYFDVSPDIPTLEATKQRLKRSKKEYRSKAQDLMT